MEEKVYTTEKKVYTTAEDIKNGDFLYFVANNKLFEVRVESQVIDPDDAKQFNVKASDMEEVAKSYGSEQVDFTGIEVTAKADNQVELNILIPKGISIHMSFPMAFTNRPAAMEALRDTCRKTISKLSKKYTEKPFLK